MRNFLGFIGYFCNICYILVCYTCNQQMNLYYQNLIPEKQELLSWVSKQKTSVSRLKSGMVPNLVSRRWNNLQLTDGLLVVLTKIWGFPSLIPSYQKVNLYYGLYYIKSANHFHRFFVVADWKPREDSSWNIIWLATGKLIWFENSLNIYLFRYDFKMRVWFKQDTEFLKPKVKRSTEI